MKRNKTKFRIKLRFILIALMVMSFYSNVLSQKVRLVPFPQEVQVGKGTFELTSDTKIECTVSSYKEAEVLQYHLQQLLNSSIRIVELENKSSNVIKFLFNEDLEHEGYHLNISSSDIQITASSDAGWFYGIQTLLQLIANAAIDDPLISITEVSIKDRPRFSWRAFMLDEARYFKGMNQVKMLLDEMAFLKLNVFHWHLTDDQGWRVEIKKYPLLTQIGSKRKSTQVGPLKWDSPIQSAEPHEGYYTQQEIKEIINYAEERHITIVPEIEMPGHSSAAIASYPWLGTAKKEIEVPIRFGVGKDVYDVSDPKVYQLLTDVLDEVIDLFPTKVIHIGGDEVKYTHWKESESVKAYMKEKKLASPADLQVFFTNSISHFLQTKGRRMMGWNEIMGHNLHEYQDEADTETSQRLAKETVVHFWKGDVTLANHAASNGYDIVNSLHTYTYLDYDYNSIPLSRAYAFDPIPSELDPKYHEKVIGTGCQMWGEWIPTNGHMHFQVFPRIAAYAEVGWTNKENKDYDRFSISLKNLQKRWDKKGIYYAPNSVIEGEKK